jgi:hypothetical protein
MSEAPISGKFTALPSDSAVAAFFDRHKARHHAYVGVVCKMLEAGEGSFVTHDDPVACDVLLPTYEVRARILETFKSEHAVRLRAEVAAFCLNLAKNRGKSMRWMVFRAHTGTHYLFAEQTETLELLGALQVVSKLHVSPEEWDSLWK